MYADLEEVCKNYASCKSNEKNCIQYFEKYPLFLGKVQEIKDAEEITLKIMNHELNECGIINVQFPFPINTTLAKNNVLRGYIDRQNEEAYILEIIDLEKFKQIKNRSELNTQTKSQYGCFFKYVVSL